MTPPDSLLQMLTDYSHGPALPFHMPGHKRHALHSPALPWGLDITEIDGFDDLHDPEGILAESMARAARLWGSRRAWYLVNGSTGGILAALHAALPRGSTLLAARNCHKSLYHALELLDLEPVFLTPPADPATGLAASLPVEAVQAALTAHPEAKALFLTSPTYEGVLSDLPRLAKLCHAHGAALIVDEAHGPHLGFSPFPAGAVAAGADLVVQSLHKTLPSLTQTAILHWQGNLVDPDRVARSLGIFQTSSPSYLFLASMDGCVRLLEENGAEVFHTWAEALGEFDGRIAGLRRLSVLCHGADKLCAHPGFFAHDPSKLVISTLGTGLTGPALMARLRKEFSIELEMAGPAHVLAMTGPGDRKTDLAALAHALLTIDRDCPPGEQATPPVLPPVPARALSAGAALEREAVVLPFARTPGMTAAEYLWAYPPGIPLAVPGEVVSPALLESLEAYLRAGLSLKSTAGSPTGHLRVLPVENP